MELQYCIRTNSLKIPHSYLTKVIGVIYKLDYTLASLDLNVTVP